MTSSKPTLYVFFFLAALVSLVVARRLARSRTSSKTPEEKPGSRTPASDKKDAPHVPGQWTPSSFRMPTPPPYPGWSLEGTKPLPYRAFRHGPKYNVTMGLRTERLEDWIQLDSDYPRYHADKARRIAERGAKCCHTAPEARPAALELLEELAAYLPARYPSLYRRTPGGGLENLWSGEQFDIPRALNSSSSETDQGVEDPMATCARLVQDDLALMVERPDGQYYLLAGAVLLAGFWRLEDKVGMPLSEIHTSGDVPQFRERLERGMLGFFRRLRCGDLYARNNYFVQVDDDLAWSRSIGPEDGGDGVAIGWDTAEKDRAVEHHFFRSERQTLRRLPRTGAVVFTIRTYFHPVVEIAQEDYVPGRLASGIRSWGSDVRRYKGYDKYGEVLLEYLDKEHQKQLDRGLDMSKEDEARQYPW